jgi:integrase
MSCKDGNVLLDRGHFMQQLVPAVDSGTDPDVPLEFGAFGITVNPVASVSARSLAKYNRARERTLSAPELTAFLKRVDAIEQVQQREALKLCLYLGGQRPTQLLRTLATDIDIDAGSVTLHDKKGRRRTGPRRHVIPLTSEASMRRCARYESYGGAPFLGTKFLALDQALSV